MVIQTMERGFTVVRLLKTTADVEIALCRDLLEKTSRLYTLIQIKNPDITYKVLPLFVEQVKNKAFEDLVECFSQAGNFYILFRYTDKPLLSQRLAQGQLSLPERLEIGRSLLERMTLLNMPPALQYEALNPRNVTVDDALAVSFNYQLEALESYFSINQGSVQLALAEMMGQLFAKEIAAQASPELAQFLEKLERVGFRDYLDIYQQYDWLYEFLRQLELEGRVQPRSFLFRLWEKIKGLTRYVRPLLACLVVLAAFSYLIYTILYPTSVPVTADFTGFKSIGTVEIRQP